MNMKQHPSTPPARSAVKKQARGGPRPKSHKKKSHLWPKAMLAFVVASGVIAAAATLSVTFLEANRDRLITAISDKLGREVAFNGPIRLSLSWHGGLGLAVEKVTIKNADWATDSYFADVGRLKLGVSLPPLLRKRLEITTLQLDQARVNLQAAADGTANWQLGAKPTPDLARSDQKTADKTASAAMQMPVSLRADGIHVTNSEISFRNPEGQVTLFSAQSLLVEPGVDTSHILFKGQIADVPMELQLDGGAMDMILVRDWPFDVSVQYGSIGLHAKGAVKDKARKITFDQYALAAGGSYASGQMQLDMTRGRPFVFGSVEADTFSPLDFKTPSADPEKEQQEQARSSEAFEGRVFSIKPLAFDLLRAFDAEISIAVADMPLGLTRANKLMARADLKGGRLMISPLRAYFAGALAEGVVKIDASTATPRVDIVFKARDMNLSQIASLGGVESFIDGKSDVYLDIAATGQSPHDLASTADGQINLIAAGAALSGRALGPWAGVVGQILPTGMGFGGAGVNCLVSRIVLDRGLMKTEEVLIDTDAVTIEGKGMINLNAEDMDLMFDPSPKGMGLTALTPPVRVRGTLKKPQVAVDPTGGVRKVAGIFGGGLDSVNKVFGPESQIKSASCAALLSRHQKPAPAAASSVVTDATAPKSIGGKLKEMGDQLFQNLGAELLGGLGGR